MAMHKTPSASKVKQAAKILGLTVACYAAYSVGTALVITGHELAHLLERLGRDEEAEQAFRQPIGYHLTALRQVPPGQQRDCHERGAVELLGGLALFQQETGKPAEARQTLRDALRIFPGCPPLLDIQRRLGEKR